MNTLTISRKNELIERARSDHHTHIYVPDKKDYIKGLLHEPNGCWTYQGTSEPIVDPKGLYDLDQNNAWLTVNQYNALVLNTRNMLIADIDFGDQRLNRFAGAKDC